MKNNYFSVLLFALLISGKGHACMPTSNVSQKQIQNELLSRIISSESLRQVMQFFDTSSRKTSMKLIGLEGLTTVTLSNGCVLSLSRDRQNAPVAACDNTLGLTVSGVKCGADEGANLRIAISILKSMQYSNHGNRAVCLQGGNYFARDPELQRETYGSVAELIANLTTDKKGRVASQNQMELNKSSEDKVIVRLESSNSDSDENAVDIYKTKGAINKKPADFCIEEDHAVLGG